MRRHRLAIQLIVSITLLIALAEGATAYLTLRTQERQLLGHMVLGADQLSRSITSATWHAMLADDRQAASEMMRTIATKQGVDWIRIFNKEGRIMFSTRPEAGRVVDKNAEACFMCHARGRPLVRVDVPTRARTFRDAAGHRRLGMVTPIYNEPACSSAGCHAHAADVAILGILDVGLDLSSVDAELADLKLRSGLMLLGELVLISGFLVFFVRHYVHRPIRQLIAGTHAVSAMELDRPIDVTSSREMEDLARSFNAMRERLKQALDEINASRAQLETRVVERTAQLETAQRRLIHSDRLASLGQLAASVAHEINNPLAGVLTLSALMRRILGTDGIPPGRVEEFRGYLAEVEGETKRAGRIVTDLLAFSRRSPPRRGPADLNDIVHKTVAIADHQLHMHDVWVVCDLAPDLPRLSCDASQIQQVLLNLLLNASESITGTGSVTITTRVARPGELLHLRVRDTGAGIPPDVLPRIFDPFFTTKAEGKGMGLGLAVVYGIVQSHGGDIEVTSAPGEGTEFCVSLPVQPVPPAADDAVSAADTSAARAKVRVS